MSNDGWHGSEDYPGPAVDQDDFTEWAKQLGWPQRHRREQVSLTKALVWLLLASGTGVLWGVIVFIIVTLKEMLWGS